MEKVLVKEDSGSWVRFGNVDGGWLCRECPAWSDRKHVERTFVLGFLVSPLPSPLSELLSSATFLGFPGSPASLTIDRPQSFNSCPSVHIWPSWGLVLWVLCWVAWLNLNCFLLQHRYVTGRFGKELHFYTRLLEIMGPWKWKAQGGLSGYGGQGIGIFWEFGPALPSSQTMIYEAGKLRETLGSFSQL